MYKYGGIDREKASRIVSMYLEKFIFISCALVIVC